jgi:hypothetical protein
MYFVSEDYDFLLRYINALMLFVGDVKHHETFIQKYPLWEPIDLWKKQFHSLDMKKILAHTDQNDALWREILTYLSSEEIGQKYIFVISNLPELYKDPETETGYGKRGQEFFWKTRNRAFQFIAPMTWQGYTDYIDTDYHLILYMVPILFSPRPENIPPCPLLHIAPDKRYTYG